MLIWCLKQVKDSILKVPRKFKFLLGYTKLLNVLYPVLFLLTSDESDDDVLVRLSLIEQLIKDANLMSISFSVKYPQTFWEL